MRAQARAGCGVGSVVLFSISMECNRKAAVRSQAEPGKVVVASRSGGVVFETNVANWMPSRRDRFLPRFSFEFWKWLASSVSKAVLRKPLTLNIVSIV